MTREIKFRGKRLDNSKWVVGGVMKHLPPPSPFGRKPEVAPKWYILMSGSADWHMERPKDAYEVDPSTVGQYTGLKDKNGNEIWEGDLVKGNDWFLCAVEYGIQEVDAFEGIGFNLWDFYGNHDDIGKAIRLQQSIEVVGNIHDNPELIKSKEND